MIYQSWQEYKRHCKVKGQWRLMGSGQATWSWILISSGISYFIRVGSCMIKIGVYDSSRSLAALKINCINNCFFSQELLDVKSLPSMKLQSWCKAHTKRAEFLNLVPRSLFDLVDKCLAVNPRLRISAEEALSHEFFAPCHESLRKHRMSRRDSMGAQNGLVHK